ncbi:hypothetical protein V1478_013019 [Vespula squamosa]|uniref:Uncharacterized protein n=1 Tax=Vespula squamosa TaxID=30214 RepID=A0ABD2A9M2_VESSQ
MLPGSTTTTTTTTTSIEMCDGGHRVGKHSDVFTMDMSERKLHHPENLQHVPDITGRSLWKMNGKEERMGKKKEELNIADLEYHVHGARKRESKWLSLRRFRELRRAAAVKICATHATMKLSQVNVSIRSRPEFLQSITYDKLLFTKLY